MTAVGGGGVGLCKYMGSHGKYLFYIFGEQLGLVKEGEVVMCVAKGGSAWEAHREE